MHHSPLHQCPELGSGFLCRIKRFGHIRNDKQAKSNLAEKKCFNSWSVRNCHKDTSALYTSVAAGSITYCPRALLHILAADTNATLFLQIIYHFISAIASHITCNNKQPLLLFSADWVSFLSRSKLNCLRSLDFQFVGYFWFLHLMAVSQKGAMF